MKKQILTTLAFGLAVIVLLGGIKYMQFRAAIAQASANAMPPETVTTIMAGRSSWPESYSSIGTLAASRGVTLKAEEAGVVRQIFFESGQAVEAQQPLIELDVSVEEADLKGALAALERTRKDFERSRKLIDNKAISQSEFERSQTQLSEAQAAVESLRAKIARKKIVAPFGGKTGIRMVNVGQYLSAGDDLVPLYTLDPLFLNFSLPQRAVKDIAAGLAVKVTVDVFPDQEFDGKVTTVNPQINEVTRNLEIQATVPNPDGRLRPGMFSRVTVLLPKINEYVTIPSSSVYHLPYADTVFVVENSKDPSGKEFKTVRQQVVKLGPRRGNQAAIIEGLTPGEEVVTSGAFKLRPNVPIVVRNDLAPANDPAPQPMDS
ncbi:MAG: efflux RND transporter periplasmic adaptor subunit [Deltaproteobacteria bacterium]|nr:efflux RND transporter periplasmic adaptor subunit [Deltaproteobacteria bacterium]